AFGLSRERVQDSVVVMRQQIKGDCVVKVRVGTVEPCPSLLAVHMTACLRDDRREDKELLLLALGWLGVSILPAFHGARVCMDHTHDILRGDLALLMEPLQRVCDQSHLYLLLPLAGCPTRRLDDLAELPARGDDRSHLPREGLK